MATRTAARLKALDQARLKMEELSKEGIVAFTFMLTDDGPELCGEEDIATQMMEVLEENKIIEKAQRIKLRGQVLSHRNTRTMKIVDLQDIFDTTLPPLALPLDELVDYDLIRTAFCKMMKSEGLKTLWRPGQDPPAAIQAWWGPHDWDIFRSYQNQNLNREVMELIRARYPEHRKNSIIFFRDKIRDCYRQRLGNGNVERFHMAITKEEIEGLKQEKNRRINEDQNVQVDRELEERVQREVAERVEKALLEHKTRERGRQTAVSESPKRRKTVRKPENAEEVVNDLDDLDEPDVQAETIQQNPVLQTMSELADLADPNCSVLQDAAAIAVVRGPPAAENAPGTSRPTRQLFHCMFEGCSITRSSRDAMRFHCENSH